MKADHRINIVFSLFAIAIIGLLVFVYKQGSALKNGVVIAKDYTPAYWFNKAVVTNNGARPIRDFMPDTWDVRVQFDSGVKTYYLTQKAYDTIKIGSIYNH